MSVFKSIKGTFQNVHQDIVDGLRALTSLDSTPRHERLKRVQEEGISLDAGADLLYRYQKEWADIQNYTTESAKQAEKVDSTVSVLFSKCEKRWELLCHLEEEVAGLSPILQTMNTLVSLIESLQQDFAAVEEELDQLENVCEEQAQEKEKASHLGQLSSYRKAKESECLAVKAKLWEVLKGRAKELETRRSNVLHERQQVFENAFIHDMDFYRTHGHVERLPSGTEFPKVSSLSQINLDESSKALDEFLSADGDPSSDAATGEAFFEDDYTTDYSVKQDEDFLELALPVQEHALTLVFDEPEAAISDQEGKEDEASHDKKEEFRGGKANGEITETEKLDISATDRNPDVVDEHTARLDGTC